MIFRAFVVWFFLGLLACLIGCSDSGLDGVTIYPAQKIITMAPCQPTVTAVAVEGERIIAMGDPLALQARFTDPSTRVDERFAGKVIMPGFIDPHIHPTIAATILPMEIVAAMSWPTAYGYSQPVRGAGQFTDRLSELHQQIASGEWLMAWGYHEPYHGRLDRQRLDAISTDRPIMIWQRSVHEMYFNSRALEELGLTEEEFAGEPHANWERGHLWETGLFSLGKPMMAKIASPANYLRGLSVMSELIHRGGVTTVGEQGFPQTSSLLEYWSLRWEIGNRPYRFVLVPNAMYFSNELNSTREVVAAAQDLLGKSSDRIRVQKHIKYYADGAIYSQLMQMTQPYLDGHHGEWMIPPERQTELLRAFWQAGWDVHIHVNGDAGLDKVLDDVERMRAELPAHNPRIVLEHYGYARADQHKRVASLGVAVSNNPYYLYELAPVYAKFGLGRQRSENISPLGGLYGAGVDLSFHSDFTMAPLQPLTLAWVAVNRIASDGQQWGAAQTIPLDAALEAITIGAARSLGLEDEIGSIEPGKKADFTVLEDDPYEVPLAELKAIRIWGTVFEGEVYPLLER